MKKIIFALLIICFGFFSKAQTEHPGPAIKDTVRFSAASITPIQFTLLPGPADIWLTADSFVNKIVRSFDYWGELFNGYKTTLYIYAGGDSILKAENADNYFSFTKAGNKWRIKNFHLKTASISLNHIACGLSSKQVFKLLNKKLKKPVGDGRVWVSNSNSSYRFLLEFSKDQLIGIRL